MKSAMPRIETQHLILRLPELSDISGMHTYYKENETHLSPFNPKKPEGFYTDAFWEDRIPKYHETWKAGHGLILYGFSKEESATVCTIEFSQIVRGPFQACYLGYGIAKKHEGKGLMFEALKAAIEFAFKDLNIHRIMANHLPENHRSGKILQRLGFIKECVAKNYLRINGRWQDHVLNSLTNENWIEKPI